MSYVIKFLLFPLFLFHFLSYSDSDIDVAVIVAEGEITNKWEQWADLWEDIRKVNVLIEPVLLEDHEDSMLYREVMRTGIAA
jgi:predicted nucleotidyltransferase